MKLPCLNTSKFVNFLETHMVFSFFFFILLYFKIFPNKPWRVNTWGQKSNKKCSIKLLTQLALKYDPPLFICIFLAISEATVTVQL